MDTTRNMSIIRSLMHVQKHVCYKITDAHTETCPL